MNLKRERITTQLSDCQGSADPVVLAGVETRAGVESVVERDLVDVRHHLVKRGVVQGGGEVAQEAGQTLAGVHDVAVGAEDDDEPVHRLQHEVSELLRREKLRLPVGLDLVSLVERALSNSVRVKSIFILINFILRKPTQLLIF